MQVVEHDGGTTRKQVLLVDADVQSRERLLRPFNLFGYRVNGADDGFSALRAFETDRPDAVVTSLSLPDLSGFELATRIRSHPRGGYPTIVGLTPDPVTEERRVIATEAGCDLLVSTALLPWTFVARVDQAIRLSRDLRALSRKHQEVGLQLHDSSERARARARDVIQRSQATIEHAALLSLASKIIRDHLPSFEAVITVADVSRAMGVPPNDCRRALDTVARFGFLERLADGTFMRKDWRVSPLTKPSSGG